jgi:hypothetical protein
MIINHQYRFISIKVQKTAGASVEIALSQFCGPTDVITPPHKKDEVLRESLSFRGPQNYYLPIGRYESLEDDLLEIDEQLKLPKFAIPQAKHEYRMDRRKYQQALDAQSKAIIETTYAKELEEFGYRWAV